MNRLDSKSHRYLIENCKKKVASNLFKKVKYGCNSTIGRNLRNIALEANSLNMDLLNHIVIDDMVYHTGPNEEKWRIQIV